MTWACFPVTSPRSTSGTFSKSTNTKCMMAWICIDRLIRQATFSAGGGSLIPRELSGAEDGTRTERALIPAHSSQSALAPAVSHLQRDLMPEGARKAIVLALGLTRDRANA